MVSVDHVIHASCDPTDVGNCCPYSLLSEEDLVDPTSLQHTN